VAKIAIGLAIAKSTVHISTFYKLWNINTKARIGNIKNATVKTKLVYRLAYTLLAKFKL